MPVPDTHLRQIIRWCAQRVPEHARDRVRLDYAKRGSFVTLFEVRAPRPGSGPEWTRRAMAQLRHDGAHWRLYWRDDYSNRWRLYDDTDPEVSPAPLLEVVDDGPGAFWWSVS